MPVIEIQHHWAHAASLISEHDLDEAVVLTVDGTGHGTDGNAWGGEVMRADLSKYDRLAHLQYIPLIGSERALYDLKRLKFAVDCLNGEDTGIVDENTGELMRKIMKNSVGSSSLGRFLDTVAYTLGICTQRTYDGEPAMKTEPYLAKGKFIEGFETETVNGTIMTAHLFKDIPRSARKEDVAYTMVKTVIDEMVNVACDDALSKGIDTVGISGGVSYSAPICRMTEEAVLSRGLKFKAHDRVPNGDGGISVGQAAIALKSIQ